MKNRTVKNFLQKLGLIGAGAAVFGLVAGGTFAGITKMTNTATTQQTALVTEAENGKEEKEEESSIKFLTTTTGDGTEAKTEEGTIASVAASAMPSIVAITAVSEEEYRTIFGQSTGQTYESEAAGSGIIVGSDDEYLYVATNNHVVTGATALTIEFIDGTTASGEIKGTDSKNDLAVVEISISELEEDTKSAIKIATMGDSDNIQVGETAIAIGNALGYGQSVTTGIISATNRLVDSQDATTGEAIVTSLIQTDAAINPGNSGGALLNAKGEVIGINSSKYADTTVEGMGFAIPSNTAKDIIQAIIDGTLEERQANAGYLGISGMDISKEDAEKYNMPQGVYVAMVGEGTPAEKAGLRKGQIITKIDTVAITSASQLAQVIQSYQGGDVITVTVAVADNGDYVESEVSVTLGTQAEKETEEQQNAQRQGRGNAGDETGEEYGPNSDRNGQYSEEYGQYGGEYGQNGEDSGQYYYGTPDQQMPGDGSTQYYYGDLDDIFEQFFR